jgi:hypothetical protein
VKESETWDWNKTQSNSDVRIFEGDSEGDPDSEGESNSEGNSDSEGDSEGGPEGDSEGGPEGDSEGGPKEDSEGGPEGDSEGSPEGESEGQGSDDETSEGNPVEQNQRPQRIRSIPSRFAEFDMLQDTEIDSEGEIIQCAMLVDSEPVSTEEALKQQV